MERKKIISKIAILIITMISILAIVTNVNAATETSLYLGLEEYRSSNLAYKALEKIMWKITSYDTDGSNPNKNRAIYCVKAGPGFGSGDEMGSGEIIKRNYTVSYNLKDYASIDSEYQAVLPSNVTDTSNTDTVNYYNSLVWVLDHCYVPAQNSTEIEFASKYRSELLTAAGIPYSTISDDEIDIAQQLAIWYFTNNDEYKVTNGTFALWVKSLNEIYRDIGDKFSDGYDRNDDAIKLFKYLVDEGRKAGSTTPVVNNASTIEIKGNGVTVSRENGNYIVGPYTIETEASEYDLQVSLKDSTGTNNIPYSLLDSNKQPTNLTLKDLELAKSQFYLVIPETQNIDDAKLSVSMTNYETQLTFWSVAGANPIDQPVVEIKRIQNTDTDEIVIEAPEYKFDLALRKYILQINGKDVTTSRVPVISSETISQLANASIHTVTKEHTKTPLMVNTGDTVLYEIRIYNEGELDGYATEITDYLPNGLALKENSTINAENGWTNPSGDGKTIVTSKLSTELLSRFDGTTIDSSAVQVECVVTATNNTEDNISLKNVAEITDDCDANGNEITDIDSIPNNLTDSQKQNYNPGESEKGWGYEDDDDYEELVLPGKVFDLALRKFITSVNGKELVDSNGKFLREPTIGVTALAGNTATTADYKHQKDPVGVRIGDIVIYTLRIYNEGEVDGYASSITDYLPPHLEFVTDDEENFNASYGWMIDSTLRKATTTKLAKNNIDEENLIKAFDAETMTQPDYVELKIKCRVKSTAKLYEVITNIAEITDFTDAEGNEIKDRDSSEFNVTLPTDENLPDYKGNTSNKSILTDKTYHYKGQEDDDDFEKLIIEEFDLALRKFITGVNEKEVTNRIPVFTKNLDENGNYIYEHTKEPIEVETADIVEYTIRIYNEGNISGYAKEIKDNIPSGLEFLPQNETNIEYRWIMLDENGNETTDVDSAKYITTDYLSKEQEDASGENLLKAFNQETMVSPDYKDVKVAFKVIAPNTYEGIITNIAEISDDSDENGNEIEDRDSTPNNDDKKEDDIDVEHIKLTYFDLALRKFITAVNNTEVTNRYPVFKIDEEGNYVYEHTKEPVEVENGNIVTYTLRIYNEGKKAGYAKQVKDDLPEGLEFLPENGINTEYRWVMLDENGNVTENLEEAVSIVTDYLSKEQADKTGRDNLLKPFNKDTMEEPDYRDIKIAFKVTEPNTSDRILINEAQISDDSDENGDEVIDKDSTPDKWIENEDDQDIEKVKVKYFDLALRKWVTQAIVIENGKETVTETGHKAEDDPEEVVKVEIVQSKLNKVVVKFRYKIRVTNEGEIAGYVDEISDYIPEGLKFVAADNPQWKEVEGKVVTDQLKDTLLQPGESAEVEILLTWINGKDNLGLKVNVAEISKDRNDSNTEDIDSTPDNKKEGEDDIDDAPVILITKTGAGIDIQYIILTVGCLSILATGIIFIKKYVI